MAGKVLAVEACCWGLPGCWGGRVYERDGGDFGGDGGGSVSIVPKYFKPLRIKAGLCHQLPHLKIILTSSRILQRSHKLIHYI
ncbi:MAG: hypothetical protein JW762_03620, partial [Dehalococcoidales bacterium]|nr:hypothetical protein [Dehalococcoidales bacterium]